MITSIKIIYIYIYIYDSDIFNVCMSEGNYFVGFLIQLSIPWYCCIYTLEKRHMYIALL